MVFNEARRAYSFASASEPKQTNPTEFQGAILSLKVGRAQGPDGIPNRVLKHLPLSVVSLLVVLFNAIFRKHYFPAAWKHARVFDPVTWEGSGAALILLTHTSDRHDWQIVRENPTLQDSLRSERTRATAR